uniref:hypothetical protein n=1 Tax=Mariniflexile sp. TaxID=1979402 RepID=UPI0040470F11
MSHEKYPEFIAENNRRIGEKSKFLEAIFRDIPYITFNRTNGAFYNTIIFKKDTLKVGQKMKIDDPKVQALLQEWIRPEMPLDQQFVYYLLAAKKVCVVPISSFASSLLGFRVTLLEENEAIMQETFKRIKEGILEYCESV